jgi:uncharacterized membrane protein
MTGLRIALSVLASTANGITAGIMLSTVIGIVPMFLSLPYDRYVQSVQFLWRRYDPIMPITNSTALVLDLVLAVFLAPTAGARAGWIISAGLLATVIVISVTRNVPVNKYVFGLDAAAEPDDWAQRDPRSRWSTWNRVRTALAVAAFVSNVVALTQLN